MREKNIYGYILQPGSGGNKKNRFQVLNECTSDFGKTSFGTVGIHPLFIARPGAVKDWLAQKTATNSSSG